MQLQFLDWVIIVGYFLITLAIGVFFTRRAGKSLSEFFVSGRSLPWWIAGTSMVATTFAADTPLAVTGLIVKNGLAGNWFWWAFAMGGMFTVFVYARLWRRAEVMTDVELIRIRYGGSAASGLRYLRSVYVALIVNPIIIGWVIGAMLKVLQYTVFADAPVGGTFWTQSMLCWATIVGMMVVVGIYCTMSGMWGVAIADMMQFAIAMVGCIWLAIVAVNHVGGIEALQTKVEQNFGDRSAFDYLPSVSSTQNSSADYVDFGEGDGAQVATNAKEAMTRFTSDHKEELTEGVAVALAGVADKVTSAQEAWEADPSEKNRKTLDSSIAQVKSSITKAMPGPWMLLHVFLIMLTMQWWATWYPGAEPGGGGYVVQRMASCKDEKHAVFATLWYQVAHYCVRPWPWIMISFAALAIFPELRTGYIADDSYDPGIGFPMLMKKLCTPGLAGMMLVAFFAAFMSTMSTQMNWGASYLVRDFVQPLFMKDADDKKLTTVSRIVSIGILVVGLLAGILMAEFGISVDDAWKMLAALGAGTGLVLMLRWFWWRINAWSEIIAMLASLGYFILFSNADIQNSYFGRELLAEEQMVVVAFATIATWLLATFVTPAESNETLVAFFRKVRPGGSGWKPVAAQAADVVPDQDLGISVVGALFASGIVYFTLPAIGYLIFGNIPFAIGCSVAAIVCGLVVAWVLKKLY